MTSTAVTAACVALFLAACDPSPPDTNVVLGRTDDGRLQLIVNLCSTTLDHVELGAGDDWSHRGDVTIEPRSDTSGHLEITLDDASRAFVVEGTSDLAAIEAPFFVTVWVEDGELASQAFLTLPRAGEITYISPESGKPVAGSLEDVAGLQNCPL